MSEPFVCLEEPRRSPFFIRSPNRRRFWYFTPAPALDLCGSLRFARLCVACWKGLAWPSVQLWQEARLLAQELDCSPHLVVFELERLGVIHYDRQLGELSFERRGEL